MDCTLRDGGYLNDWKFGKETIYGVTREVPKTGVDIFELCFMRDQPFSEDRCVFSSVESSGGKICRYDRDRMSACNRDAFGAQTGLNRFDSLYHVEK